MGLKRPSNLKQQSGILKHRKPVSFRTSVFLILIIFIGFGSAGKADAQTSVNEKDSLLEALTSGKVSGYWRSYFMATDNYADYQNWHALATGGLLKYETGSFKNMQVGAGFYYSHNVWSNVQELDPLTGKPSRYELGLFDVEDRFNKEIPMLGEIYVKYQKNAHTLQAGRFKLVSPFLNPEDGRMIPTLEQGYWYMFQPQKNKSLKAQLGWITHIGARSTAGFVPVSESMGKYPVGKNPDGTNSGYGGNVQSKGMAVVNVNYQPESKKWGVDIWNYYVENVYNSFYVNPFYELKKDKMSHKFSAQWLNQTKVADGGNPDDALTYVHDDMSNVVGVQYLVTVPKKWVFSGNWNYVTDDGRYLFPREWGREFLFTFQKRERLEGVRKTHAWMVDAKRIIALKNGQSMVIKLGYGQYYRPDAKNFAYNKYAMPANDQLNLDIFYNRHPNKKGLGFEYLIAYKRALGDTYDNPNFILNKVDMMVHNVILNYRF